MLRLSLVFFILVASTAVPEDRLEAELQETVELAWLSAGARERALLEGADRDWYHYRRLTDTNVRTIFYADECPGPSADADQRRTYARGDTR